MQLREGTPAERRKKNQELVGGGVKGVRPDWLGKRKKLQIHWTRRGWSHGWGSRHGGVEARRSRGSSHESAGGGFNR